MTVTTNLADPVWSPVPERTEATHALDAEAYALGAVLRTLIAFGAQSSARSQQNAIGSSELGYACDRRIAYRLAGVHRCNVRDPLASLLGLGWHAVMAEVFGRLNVLLGNRFLIEVPVTYRGVPGTCDLYDRETHTVIDWKTTSRSKLAKLAFDGPASNYVTQVQTYAAGLTERGEDVRHVALAFVPRDDASLENLFTWRARFDRGAADKAIDRLDELRGKDPSTVAAAPDRLCGWCSHYSPGSSDLSVGCPGGPS